MKSDFSKAFLSAVNYLPEKLWRAAFSMTASQRENCEEIRIRLGRAPKALVCGKYITLTYKCEVPIVTKEDIDETLGRATKYSIHSYSEHINNGFITTPEGHRVGVTGEIYSENGITHSVNNISCVNIRIAKPCVGIAEDIINSLYTERFYSTLIISEPGGGKTTLLRDMSRALSAEYNVSVVDERYEIAGNRNKKYSFDIGDCDIVSGGYKQKVIESIIRSMTPQIIAIDEVTDEKDIDIICRMAYCGCSFIATAHAFAIEELYKRPIYKKLIDSDIFGTIIYINNKYGKRSYNAYIKEANTNGKNNRDTDDNGIVLGNRYFRERKLSAESK